MKRSRLLMRITAVAAAVALTICGAYLATTRSERSALQTAGQSGNRQVVILDAGHGASW